MHSLKISRWRRPEYLAAVLLLSLTWSLQAQTPCPGSDSCPGAVAQLLCPSPGTTLPGNDVTFTWCNANADYFLQIESILGAHNIFYGLVPAQNFVHLLNLPTNGVTIYVTLWTQAHGTWQTPLQYIYTAANNFLPTLLAPALGTNGQFQVTLMGLTPGKTNVVQSSVDLSNWTSLSTNVAVNTSLQVVDAGATNFSRRFYRVYEVR
jgi:hypothetical protein